MRQYIVTNSHRLRQGNIFAWKVDNAKEYGGDQIDGEHGVARELVVEREFRVPHESNTNPVAERAIGVLERGTRACLAFAGAPACMWT